MSKQELNEPIFKPDFHKSLVKAVGLDNIRLREIDVRLKEIEHLGYYNASVIWRKGHKGVRNMYLLHPKTSARVQNGHSRFEYVGAKADKQQAARERLARFEEKEQLLQERAAIRQRIEAVKYHLHYAGRLYFGKQLNFAGNGQAEV